MDFTNQRNQDVNSIVHVPPTEVGDNTHDDTYDVRPRTPIPNETRTYEDRSIQTQENPDHQILENMSVDKMIQRESEHNRTVCSPSDADEVQITQSFTVPDIKEEDILEENLALKKRNEILEQCCELLIKQIMGKDEELRLKDEEINKEKNLQAKHDEDLKKTKDENARSKDEIARLEEDLKKTKDENARSKDEIARLEEDLKKTKDENARSKDEIARLEEDLKKTKDEYARLEEEPREEYEEGNEMMTTEEPEEEICKRCLVDERKIVVSPCDHCDLCEHCFEKQYHYERKCYSCGGKIISYSKVDNA